MAPRLDHIYRTIAKDSVVVRLFDWHRVMAARLHVTEDVSTLCGGELIQSLNDVERVQAELDALRFALVRRADEQREAEFDGLRSAAAWVEKHTGVPAQTTRERLRVAKRLEQLPIVAKSFA